MRTGTRHTEVLLWTAQILLAGLFVFAGAAKLAMPIAVLEAQAHMSGRFLQFIAVCELLGAAGLILPGLLRIRQGLTPVAAAGLTIIMAGAVAVSVASVGIAAAILPFVTGLIAAAVAYKRWHLVSTTMPPVSAATLAN
jgi:hypothetical protein